MKPSYVIMSGKTDVVVDVGKDWSLFKNKTKIGIVTENGVVVTYLVDEAAIFNPGIGDICKLVPVSKVKKLPFVVSINEI